MKSDYFNLLTGRENNELISFDGYLVHQNIIDDFKKLSIFLRENNYSIKIISSYRNFERQSMIWNAKVSGQRPILDDDGNIISPSDLTPRELILKIMRFSALPGLSRHHWGCDIDIYDSNSLAKEDIQLTPQECGPDGALYQFHNYLDTCLESFGFYRPYALDKGGISPERWHISHQKLGHKYFHLYDFNIFKKSLEQSDFALIDTVYQMSEELFERFFLQFP